MSKPETIHDFNKSQWEQLCVALNGIDPSAPLLPNVGICGNAVHAVQLANPEGNDNRPYVNLMLGIVFARMGLVPSLPLGEDEDSEHGPWEGPNAPARVELLKGTIREVGAILNELHAASRPSGVNVPVLA